MTVLQALNRYYGRMERRDEVEPFGFTRENVSYLVSLSPEGEIVDVYDLRVPDGRTRRPRRLAVPRPKRTSNILANFLWDKTAYAFGVDTGKSKRLAAEHADFVRLQSELLGGLNEAHGRALVSFLSKWTPERFSHPPFTREMLDESFVFRLEGEQEFFHEVPELREVWVKSLQDPMHPVGICLVTGEVGPLEDGHPIIKGVRDAQTSGAYLVSFNASAYTSYGNASGANAPTSKGAAFRYGAALNRMLDRGSRNRIPRPIGDTSVVFWADTSTVIDETAAKAAEDAFAFMFDPGLGTGLRADDASEAVKLRDALDMLAQGRPVRDLGLGLVEGTRFHVLGLAPNAARLSVRYWLDDDFEAFAKCLGEHYHDLAIEPAPWGAKPPSVQRLLVRTTALQEKPDNIPPLLAGEMMRAVLSGIRYPRTLLTAAIIRLRAGDDPGNGWHAAAIRAVLARDHRLSHQHEFDFDPTKEPPMSLDRNHPNTGYQAGRLFAVYELAQRAALGRDVKSTIRDKYFGAASATPASIFPLIITNGQNHLSKIRKEKPGWATVIEKELEEVMGRIKPTMPFSLPRSLRLEDQGEFAIGYYHQRRAKLGEDTANQPTFDDEAQEGNDPDE